MEDKGALQCMVQRLKDESRGKSCYESCDVTTGTSLEVIVIAKVMTSLVSTSVGRLRLEGDDAETLI